MGLAAAFVMPSTLSILANVFSPAERPRAIAPWAGIAAGGAALGPPTSGLLLAHFWWGLVFLVNVPLVVIALVAGRRLVPRSKDPDGHRLDVPGAALSILSVGALVYAIIEAPHRGGVSPDDRGVPGRRRRPGAVRGPPPVSRFCRLGPAGYGRLLRTVATIPWEAHSRTLCASG
jgi:MFS family permease